MKLFTPCRKYKEKEIVFVKLLPGSSCGFSTVYNYVVITIAALLSVKGRLVSIHQCFEPSTDELRKYSTMKYNRVHISESFLNAYNLKTNNDFDQHLKKFVSLEHIEVFLVFEHLRRVM